MATNFKQLQSYEPQLASFSLLVEKYFPNDSNMAHLKITQFCEPLAQFVAAFSGKFTALEEGCQPSRCREKVCRLVNVMDPYLEGGYNRMREATDTSVGKKCRIGIRTSFHPTQTEKHGN